MAISLLTNVTSLSAQRSVESTQSYLSSSISKLSSGQRINSSRDDAAALAISEKLKNNIRILNQSTRNANDGISLTQVAEGAMGEVSNILVRMRELATQASNDTLGVIEREFLDTEFQQQKVEIKRITEATQFNNIQLLNGNISGANALVLQVGGQNNNDDQIRISLDAADISALGIQGNVVASRPEAQASLDAIDNAINILSNRRADLGAIQNRLQATVSNLALVSENFSDANSRIRDTDIAEETSRLAKNQILSQAGSSMLAQANQLPQIARQILS
jgi:flagellin